MHKHIEVILTIRSQAHSENKYYSMGKAHERFFLFTSCNASKNEWVIEANE